MRLWCSTCVKREPRVDKRMPKFYNPFIAELIVLLRKVDFGHFLSGVIATQSDITPLMLKIRYFASLPVDEIMMAGVADDFPAMAVFHTVHIFSIMST